jgi:hypothetical protein
LALQASSGLLEKLVDTVEGWIEGVRSRERGRHAQDKSVDLLVGIRRWRRWLPLVMIADPTARRDRRLELCAYGRHALRLELVACQTDHDQGPREHEGNRVLAGPHELELIAADSVRTENFVSIGIKILQHGSVAG